MSDKWSIEGVREWRKSAVEDGWACIPLVRGGSVDRAATLKRDGFLVDLYSSEYAQGVYVWGPDSRKVEAPQPYSWEGLVASHAAGG